MVQLPLPSVQQSHMDPLTYPNHVYQQQEEIGGGYYSQEQTQSVQYVGFSQPQPTVHYKQSDRQQVRIVTRNHMIPESVSTGNQQNQGSHLIQQGQTQQSVAYSMVRCLLNILLFQYKISHFNITYFRLTMYIFIFILTIFTPYITIQKRDYTCIESNIVILGYSSTKYDISIMLNSISDVRKTASLCVSKWKKEVANPEPPPPKKEKKKDNEKENSEMDHLEVDESNNKDHPAEKKGNKARARVYTAKSRLTETNVILSSGFMDALAGSVEPKKKLVVRKRLPSLDSKPKEPVCDPSTTPLVLDGLFSDQTRIQPETRRTPSPQSVAAVSPPLASVEVEEPEMIPAGKRRIRFADELGKELVMIKEFEIEEGERSELFVFIFNYYSFNTQSKVLINICLLTLVNVNRMSPEDMKHHEMMMERRFMQEQSGSTEEDDETSVELGRSSSTISTNETFKDKWRLISLDDIVILVERGCNSQANLDEIERQKHAMRAFYDPNMYATFVFGLKLTFLDNLSLHIFIF
uniref:ULP_PROTEASE domain-containing protein n=1 Tax=Heterorhabditis bacteriophora TaxID=37862 RepID=A0A1I7X9S0_HETBA